MIRAYVHETYMFAADTIAVSILREVNEPGFHSRHILHLHADDTGRFTGRSWDEFEPGSVEPIAPTLTLGHEEARLVADALTNFFQGVNDERALRADYDAERKRVDRLIDTVAQIASGTPR